LGFAFHFTGRCFGPLLAAAVTAVMNRSQPSRRNSIFGSVFFDVLVDGKTKPWSYFMHQTLADALEKMRASA
jgi:hypothetical protein